METQSIESRTDVPEEPPYQGTKQESLDEKVQNPAEQNDLKRAMTAQDWTGPDVSAARCYMAVLAHSQDGQWTKSKAPIPSMYLSPDQSFQLDLKGLI